MKQIDIENQLRDVVSRLINQVDIASKQGRLDLNLALEDALIPILKPIFNLQKLRNLNRLQKNFPGIDLGDEFDRVSFQVTATTTLDKVKKTITQFRDRAFYNSFDELYILMLSKKQSSYSQSAIEKIIQGKFKFDVKTQIVDLFDILERITALRVTAQERILNEFKVILGEVNGYLDLTTSDLPKAHQLFSNLQPLGIPNDIYVVHLNINEKEVISEARKELNFKRKKYSKRSLVKMALLLLGEHSDSWVYYEGKLFSFSDVSKGVFQTIVEEETLEIIQSEDLYLSGIEENVNLLKQLLHSHIVEKLKGKKVDYQSRHKLFYFRPYDDGDEQRKETWIGKKKATRTVYDQVKSKKDPTKIAHHKHLSFSLSFLYIDNRWYCNIVPSWYYTFNGYIKSRYHEDLLKKQKRLEFNNSVKNITRFIAYFISKLEVSGNDMSFGELLCFECEDELVEGGVIAEDGENESETQTEVAQ